MVVVPDCVLFLLWNRFHGTVTFENKLEIPGSIMFVVPGSILDSF